MHVLNQIIYLWWEASSQRTYNKSHG